MRATETATSEHEVGNVTGIEGAERDIVEATNIVKKGLGQEVEIGQTSEVALIILERAVERR